MLWMASGQFGGDKPAAAPTVDTNTGTGLQDPSLADQKQIGPARGNQPVDGTTVSKPSSRTTRLKTMLAFSSTEPSDILQHQRLDPRGFLQ